MQVSASFDWSKVERESRLYEGEPRVVSRERRRARDPNAAAEAAGVPGAATNLPGGDGPEATGASEGSFLEDEERENLTHGEVRTTATDLVPDIRRLSVAVIVDGTPTGEDFAPLPEDELASLEAAVRSAAGIEDARGDTLSITSRRLYQAPVEADPLDELLGPWRPYLPYALYGLLGFIAFLWLMLWRRGVKKRRKAAARAAEEAAESGALARLTGSDSGAALARLSNAAGVKSLKVTETDPESAAVDEELRALLETPITDENQMAEIQALAAELAAEDPARAARILRGWMEADIEEAAA